MFDSHLNPFNLNSISLCLIPRYRVSLSALNKSDIKHEKYAFIQVTLSEKI